MMMTMIMMKKAPASSRAPGAPAASGHPDRLPAAGLQVHTFVPQLQLLQLSAEGDCPRCLPPLLRLHHREAPQGWQDSFPYWGLPCQRLSLVQQKDAQKRTLRPLRGLQENCVATREESGVLGFPSRRGLTPRGSLECNPEIPAFPGEENYTLATSCEELTHWERL